MTSTRSYYTTPLFVITTLISLFVFTEVNATQNFILDTHENIFIHSLNHGHNTVTSLRARNQLLQSDHIETPESIRAIYISSWVAGTPSLRNRLFRFIKDSNINAVVIDIKDSTGVISFPVSDPNINKYETDSRRISNIESIIEELHDDNVYVIGRLTSFQDPLLSKKRPDLSFTRIDNGQTWTDRKGLAFLNPKNKESWDYLADIAEYAYSIGFDEINFDYIRYPSDGAISNINYELDTGETRPIVMKSFYEYLDNRLRSKGIPISADIFGLVTTTTEDIGIGQIFEDIYPHFDGIAPMVYPSHYSSGYFNLNNPNAHPYQVITESMQSAMARAVAIEEDPDKLRTWIQDFSLGSPRYGEKEVYDQIKATYDIGLDSYMSWDPKNKYTQSAYKK